MVFNFKFFLHFNFFERRSKNEKVKTSDNVPINLKFSDSCSEWFNEFTSEILIDFDKFRVSNRTSKF